MFKFMRALPFTIFMIFTAVHGMELDDTDQNDCTYFASYEAHSAQQKLEMVWSNILQTFYQDRHPAVTGPGFQGLCDLMSADFLSKAFTHDGDMMSADRCKRIHTYGTTIKVSFIPTKHDRFTGIFSHGARNGLLRLSIAAPPEPGKIVPGIALKLFRTNLASVNIMAMNSLDGQASTNLFEHDFTTVIPAPVWSIKNCLLQWRFNAALCEIGQQNNNALRLSCDHFAQAYEDGNDVPEFKAPYQLIFRPTTQAQELMTANSPNDFRAVLEGQGLNIFLYEVYGRASDDMNEPEILIGRIKTTSSFRASKVGDDLYFKHPPTHPNN